MQIWIGESAYPLIHGICHRVLHGIGLPLAALAYKFSNQPPAMGHQITSEKSECQRGIVELRRSSSPPSERAIVREIPASVGR